MWDYPKLSSKWLDCHSRKVDIECDYDFKSANLPGWLYRMPCGETSLKRLEHVKKKESPKSQKQTGPSKQGWVGWVGSLILLGHCIRSISLVAHTTNFIYSNSRLTKKTSGWNLSSWVHLLTKRDCACHEMYSGMPVIIQVCSSVSGTWLTSVHLKKIKI